MLQATSFGVRRLWSPLFDLWCRWTRSFVVAGEIWEGDEVKCSSYFVTRFWIQEVFSIWKRCSYSNAFDFNLFFLRYFFPLFGFWLWTRCLLTLRGDFELITFFLVFSSISSGMIAQNKRLLSYYAVIFMSCHIILSYCHHMIMYYHTQNVLNNSIQRYQNNKIV